MKVAGIFTTLMMLATPATSANVRLTVYPRMAISGGVRVEAFVPRNPTNRRLRVEIDGDAFLRAFEEDMDADNARVLYVLQIDQLPEGQYVARLDVYGGSGHSTGHTTANFCRGDGCRQPELE